MEISESQDRVKELEKGIDLVRNRIEDLKKELEEAEKKEKELVLEKAREVAFPLQGQRKI